MFVLQRFSLQVLRRVNGAVWNEYMTHLDQDQDDDKVGWVRCNMKRGGGKFH